MPQMAKKSGVALRTLEKWRAKCVKDPQWRLYGRRRMGHQAFHDEQDAYVAEFLRRKFVQQLRYCPPKVLHYTAMLMKRRLLEGKTTLTDDQNLEISSLAEQVEAEDLREALHRGQEENPAEIEDERAMNELRGAENGDSDDDVWEDESDSDEEDEGQNREKGKKPPGFQASNRWRRLFLKKTKLSLRSSIRKDGQSPMMKLWPRFSARLPTDLLPVVLVEDIRWMRVHGNF